MACDEGHVNENTLNQPSALDCWDPNTGIFKFLFIYYCFAVFVFGCISCKLLKPCLVSLKEMCTSVRCVFLLFQEIFMEGSSLLPSVLSLRELWLIRTTLLFICLTCGNICNSFLVREISERTWFDFQTHVDNENQPPESEGQWGTSKGVLSSPHPSCKHQHLLEVRLKRSCWNSETQFQPERGSDVWCIMRAGDCPLLHIIIIQIMKENEMAQADNSCFYSAFQRFS